MNDEIKVFVVLLENMKDMLNRMELNFSLYEYMKPDELLEQMRTNVELCKATAKDIRYVVSRAKRYFQVDLPLTQCKTLAESLSGGMSDSREFVLGAKVELTDLQSDLLHRITAAPQPDTFAEGIPASFRNNGYANGEPLTAAYVKERYDISGSWLSKNSTEKDREKSGNKFFYRWEFIRKNTRT